MENKNTKTGTDVLGSLTEEEKEGIRKNSIKTIKELLEIENVQYVIYVDDKFDVEGQKEEFIGKTKSLKQQKKYITSGLFADFNWDGPDSLIQKFWETSANKEELLLEVCKEIEEGDDEIANTLPALQIRKYFGDKIHYLTPDEWHDDEFKLLYNLKENKKALCLFDFHYQQGNKKIGVDKNGANLIANLLEKNDFKEKVVCGIFSHLYSEENEDSKRVEYAKKYSIDKSKFYAISKHRYHNEPLITGFAEGIKMLLVYPYIEKLKKESIEIIKSSNCKAIKRISSLSPKTFNQIIQKSSYVEGIWEMNTLFRLYGILSKKENYNAISDSAKRKNFNETIAKIRNIDEKDTKYQPTVKNEQLLNLRKAELYLPDKVVNGLHLPIANGDIFKIKRKDYILLAQPCNLSLRSEGKRGNDYNKGFLIPIKEIRQMDLNHTYHKFESVDNRKNDEIICAHFSRFEVINLDFIDLVVFREDGKAIIDTNVAEIDNNIIHKPWKNRYEFILENFIGKKERIHNCERICREAEHKIKELEKTIKAKKGNKEIGQLPSDEKDALLEVLKPFSEEKKELKGMIENLKKEVKKFDEIESLKLNDDIFKDGVFKFKIKRIRRYKSPNSDDMLQKFMLYLSRNAFEHDFTN